MCLVLYGQAFSQTMTVVAVKDQSSASYKLVHPLHEIDATSKDVEYTAVIDPAKKEIDTVSATVDVMTFDSGNSNRDSHAMEVVDALTYPDVSFIGTKFVPAGDSLAVTGKLTFHGVTNDITAWVTPTWNANSLSVSGWFDISMTAFKIDRPSLLMIPVKDTLHFTLKAQFGWK